MFSIFKAVDFLLWVINSILEHWKNLISPDIIKELFINVQWDLQV